MISWEDLWDRLGVGGGRKEEGERIGKGEERETGEGEEE